MLSVAQSGERTPLTLGRKESPPKIGFLRLEPGLDAVANSAGSVIPNGMERFLLEPGALVYL